MRFIGTFSVSLHLIITLAQNIVSLIMHIKNETQILKGFLIFLARLSLKEADAVMRSKSAERCHF